MLQNSANLIRDGICPRDLSRLDPEGRCEACGHIGWWETGEDADGPFVLWSEIHDGQRHSERLPAISSS